MSMNRLSVFSVRHASRPGRYGDGGGLYLVVEKVERTLDDNEQLQKRLQREQDGSEIRSVELERAIAGGISAIERRDAMEFF